MLKRRIGLWSCMVMMMVTPGAFAETVRLDAPGAGVEVKAEVLEPVKSVEVMIRNRSGSEKTIELTADQWFQSQDGSTTYQDLAIVFPVEVTVPGGQTKRVIVKTACKQAQRGAAPVGHPLKLGKTNREDRNFGNLIVAYHAPGFHETVVTMTGSQYHDTEEKKRNFLQLTTWIYYESEKRHMVQFAAQHMFGGDERAARNFVDTFYGPAKKAIQMYKAMGIPGIPGTPRLP